MINYVKLSDVLIKSLFLLCGKLCFLNINFPFPFIGKTLGALTTREII